MIADKLPFELGETLDGTAEDGTTLINDHWLGQVFEVPAQQLDSSQVRGGKKRLVGRSLKVVALRNVSGTTLYGKRMAQLYDSAGYSLIKEVDGYTIVTGTGNCVLIDPFLDTVGVADDDIFWGVLEGPALVKTQALAGAGSNIAVGAKLIAGTGAATSGNSTAGGVATTTAPLVTELIATALSARTTANSMTDILAHFHIRFI